MARYYDRPYYKEPWYNSWRSMMGRCYNEKNASYSYYGGKGITVCNEWKTPDGFAKWADETFVKGCTLDRIDGNGNYEPSNCRWSTKKEQANNRKSCALVTYNGETHNITEWSEITGIPRSILLNRRWRGAKPPELFAPYPQDVKGKTWVIENGRRKWVNAI